MRQSVKSNQYLAAVWWHWVAYVYLLACRADWLWLDYLGTVWHLFKAFKSWKSSICLFAWIPSASFTAVKCFHNPTGASAEVGECRDIGGTKAWDRILHGDLGIKHKPSSAGIFPRAQLSTVHFTYDVKLEQLSGKKLGTMKMTEFEHAIVL